MTRYYALVEVVKDNITGTEPFVVVQSTKDRQPVVLHDQAMEEDITWVGPVRVKMFNLGVLHAD
jgi:glycerophosphoryl diester phosphodiesterase